MITTDELVKICIYAGHKRVEPFVEALNEAMREFSISDNLDREEAFLAQIIHESGEFRYVRELASGDAYEGRKDLGNTEPGDGVRFKGRGLIQITGRTNYQRCGDALGLDLINNPELLEDAASACRSAAWFWSTHGLNEIADDGDFRLITKRINGGLNGYAERLKYWDRAKQVLYREG